MMGKYAKQHASFAIAMTNNAKFITLLSIGTAAGFLIGQIFMGTLDATAVEANSNHYYSPNGVQGSSPYAYSQKPAPPGQAAKPEQVRIHTLCTSNGSPYQNYQTRIAFATYQLIRLMAGGERHVAFTRILHRTKPDVLMDEVPTFRANPLQPKCDDWCEYPVSDRGNAVRQFFDASRIDPTLIKAPWIYMVESDYVFMVPLIPPPVDTPRGKAFGYPFDYINPAGHKAEMKKLYNGDPKNIPNTGPAPLLMRTEDWIKVTPEWEKQASAIEADPELVKKLGWVREMYGFSIALTKAGIDVELKPAGENRFISQLPIESGLGKAHAFHYTQCTIYKMVANDTDVWKYDKRFYTSPEVVFHTPKIEMPPRKFEPGVWKFIEGNPVTQSKHEAIYYMIEQMNMGIDTLEDLPSDLS